MKLELVLVALTLYTDECFHHTLWPLSGVCALNKQEAEYRYQTLARHHQLNICFPDSHVIFILDKGTEMLPTHMWRI